ncbi:MAG: hypothetical protein KC519_15660, partial [Anaerolineae bacterium]|nr:hypothetical protein [Anaerolineae bacterium]
MSENSITRVHYFERQFLRTQDFTDEQAYHIAMRRRHNLAHHTWGIVRGLELRLRYNDQKKVDGFDLDAGIAVDGYGREVILAASRAIAVPAIFNNRAAEALDVYLEYHLEETDRRSVNPCAEEEDTTGATFYRWRESSRLVFETADFDAADRHDRRISRVVPAGDLTFDATRTPPDAEQRRWPIFLGRIQRVQGNEVTYKVELGGRPYAGLMAGEVRRPGDQARIVLGAGADPSFAVHVPAEAKEASLEIRKENIHLRGKTTVYGDVNVQGGTWKFNETQVEEVAHPWGVYVTTPKADADQSNTDEPEMRIELNATLTGGDNSQVAEPLGSRFAVGVWSEEKNDFIPILQVSENGYVRVFGTLVANEYAKPEAPAELTENARREINTLI